MRALVSYFLLFFFSVAIAQEQCAHTSIGGEQSVGGLGIINANILANEKAKNLAEMLAIKNLERHPEFNSADAANTKSYFYRHGIYQIALAIQSQQSINACDSLECDFKACNPAWLCGNNQANELVVVSHRSTSLKSQFSYLQKNLDDLISYLNLSKVNIDERFVEEDNSGVKFKQYSINNSAEVGEDIEVTSTLNGFCFSESDMLFAQFKIHGASRTEYENDSKALGVGRVDRLVASGLISDKLELAIKYAMIDLAKQKKIDVASEVRVKRSEDGYYKLVDTKNTGKVIVTAHLKEIQIIPNNENYSIYGSVVEI